MAKLDFLIFAVSISQDHISHLLDWHFLVRLLHTPFHFHGFTHFQFILKENLMPTMQYIPESPADLQAGLGGFDEVAHTCL